MTSAPRYEKPAILAKLPRDRSAVIEASAGTGKTYTLEHLVVDLLLETDTRIEEVLVVTFTEKATAELRRRLRMKLEELLRHTGEAPGVPEERCWVLEEGARRKLETALTSLDAATISTIHGFCQRVLAEQAFVNGRLFGEKQVDARAAFSQAFLDTLRGHIAKEEEPKELLRLWLERGESPESLEALLFEAARERGELRPPFDAKAFLATLADCPLSSAALVELEEEMVKQKLHHSKRKGLKERVESLAAWWAERKGRGDAAALLAELDAWKEEADADYLTKRLPELEGALGRSVLRWWTALQKASPCFEAALVHALLPPVRARLAERKRTLGLIDFDDMLLLLRDTLRGERGEALAEALRGRYRFALVDEFQDTDEVQWEVFRRVFHASDGKSVLYVIGDPKQAIYSFRGADVHIYLEARAAIEEAGGALVRLEDNYRSTADMVDAVNRILDQQAPSPFFDGAIDYAHPVHCGKKDFRARLADGSPAAPVALWRPIGQGSLSKGAVVAALGRRMAREVKALLSGGLVLESGGRQRALQARDIFVLTRSEAEGHQLASHLREAGVPVAFFKQEGLFQSEEAEAIRDVLTAVARPEDGSARLRAWLGPFFGLTLEEATRAREVPGTHPLLARLLGWKALADARDYERLFARLLEESGVLRRELFLGATERRLTNYQHLFELLLEEVGRSRMALPELLRLVSAWMEARQLPPGENGNVQRLESEVQAVQFMTMHKSKGLEAPVVFLAGGFSASPSKSLSVFHQDGKRCGWLGKPTEEVSSLISREQEEEDQRLLYVALTRAAARVYLPFFAELSEVERETFPLAPPLPLPKGEGQGEGSASRETLKGDYRLSGAWRVLNRRLVALREAGAGEAEGFTHEYLLCGEEAEASEPPTSLTTWTPPEDLLEEEPEDGRAAWLRRQHAGFVVTSYSRLAATSKASGAVEAEAEDGKLERDGGWRLPQPDELPSGVTAGLYLHEVLEHLPLEAAAYAPTYEEWAESEPVQTLLAEVAEKHGVEAKYLGHAARLVWAAVRTPLPLPDGTVMPGISAAARVLRELEFLYPIPEKVHPLLGRAVEGGDFTIERGCVKGFIDLVFEYAGRVYFADWKSDTLPSFEEVSVAAHVQAHYGLQEQLYTLGVVRLLGIRSEAEYEARFGGSLYLFLRAMGEGEAGLSGVYVGRASWAQVVAWEEGLLERQDYGLAQTG